MRTFKMTVPVLLTAMGVTAAGCTTASESVSEQEAPALNSINGLNSMNGLTANGLLLSADGRNTMSYLVRCALPAGATITQNDKYGTPYTFAGEIGVAPQWATGACDQACQEQISACVLAHVNTSGQHIALWLDGDSPALGWGRSTDYPYQEGSFFGNIFQSPPKAFYCNGKDFDQGVVPGRLGANQAGAPYVNPFASSGGYCVNACAGSDTPHMGDGYKACNGYNHVVTVWRNFDTNTNYKICSRASGNCLDIAGSSMNDAAQLIQSAYTGAASQKWKILQVSPGQYKVINVNSGKALDVGNGATTNGAWVQQYSFWSGPNQLWTFTPSGSGYYKFSPGSNANGSLNLHNGSTASGSAVDQWTWNSSSLAQQWNITPAS